MYLSPVKPGREQVVAIAALIALYAAFYLCRANVDAALPLLARAYGYDKEQLGRLASIAIFAYAVGKLALGSVADFLGGWLMLALVIAGSVAGTFCFGASGSLLWLTGFAAINRFFQAGGWCSVVELSSRRFEAARYGTVMGIISSSYEIGNVLSLLFCGLLVRLGFGWRWLFVFNPLLFAAIGAASLAALWGSRRPPSAHREAPLGAPRPGSPVLQLFSNPTFLSALGLSFLLTFVRTGLLTWLPTFLAEATGPGTAGVAGGIVKSAVFPAAGIVGALAAGRVSDIFGPGRRGPVVVFCLASLSVSVLALGHAGIHDTRVAVSAIAGSGLFLLGPYSLVGGAVVLDVAASSRPALVSGILDSAGYVGGSLSGIVLGSVAQRLGWSRAFDVVAAAAITATLLASTEVAVTRLRSPAQKSA